MKNDKLWPGTVLVVSSMVSTTALCVAQMCWIRNREYSDFCMFAFSIIGLLGLAMIFGNHLPFGKNHGDQ